MSSLIGEERKKVELILIGISIIYSFSHWYEFELIHAFR